MAKIIPFKEVVDAPSDDSTLGVPANYDVPGEACTRAESERGDKLASGNFCNLVFGHVPSQFEVENAVSAFQNFMQEISSPGSTSSWFIQMFRDHGPKLLQSPGFGRVFDAFRLLQKEQAFQRLVVSLVSDKAVWDAVLKNKVVRQLRNSLFPALEGGRPRSYDNEQDWVMHIIRWILDIAKAKVMELIESFRELANEIFQNPGKEKPTAEGYNQLDEKIRSSVLLTIVIYFIVFVIRAKSYYSSFYHYGGIHS